MTLSEARADQTRLPFVPLHGWLSIPQACPPCRQQANDNQGNLRPRRGLVNLNYMPAALKAFSLISFTQP